VERGCLTTLESLSFMKLVTGLGTAFFFIVGEVYLYAC
jgi:hypothetical protein